MPADYTHTGIGAADTLTAATWNGDHENHITNRSAVTLEGAAATVAALKEVFDAGDIGTENLPQTVKDEIQALRHQIKTMKQATQWYVSNTTGYGWTQGQQSWDGTTNIRGLPDGSTNTYWWQWVVPPDYVSGDITIRYYMASRGASGGVADLRSTIFSLQAESDLSNQTAGNTEVIFTGESTWLAANVPAVGTTVLGHLDRYGADASDTNTGIIQLLAIRFAYTARAGGAKR